MKENTNRLAAEKNSIHMFIESQFPHDAIFFALRLTLKCKCTLLSSVSPSRKL